MFHTRLGISKEHILDGLFQKVVCVGLLSFGEKAFRAHGTVVVIVQYRVDSFQARAALTNRNSRVSKNEGAEL